MPPNSEPAATKPKTFLGHPRGLRTLFSTEAIERFSYYGNRALIVPFLTASIAAGGMALPPAQAAPIYGIYTSTVWLMALPGGWLADAVLGAQRSVLIGALVILCGHVCLALHGTTWFFLGLLLLSVGTGLLKPCISAMVGGLYIGADGKADAEAQSRRDRGYGLFYLGINIGALLAPQLCSYLAQEKGFHDQLVSWGLDPRASWHWGFGAAAVLMAIGTLCYVLGRKDLGEVGAPPANQTPEMRRRNRRILGVSAVGAAGLGLGLLLVESTATHVHAVAWTATDATACRLEGIDAADGGATMLLADGVLPEQIEHHLDAAAAAAIRSDLAAGQRAGRIDSLDIARDGWLFTWGARRFRAVLWQAAPQDAFSLVAADVPHGVDPVLGRDMKLSALGGMLGAEAVRTIQSARDAGQRSGNLIGVDIKLGGLTTQNVHAGFGIALLLVVTIFFYRLFRCQPWSTGERARLRMIAALFAGASAFWGVFEQAGSTLTLFADSTRNEVFGYEFGTARWQSLNPLFVIALTPLFSAMWQRLGARAPSYPTRFAIGIALAGLGFLWLVPGAQQALGGTLVGIGWLAGCYFLHTVGELFLSPSGLSSISALAPKRVLGLMMGVWFLASSVGSYVGGTIAGWYGELETPTLLTLVALSAFAMAVCMFLIARPLQRMLASAPPE